MGKRETKKAREQRIAGILARLDAEYGTDYRCYLNHETPWQLLIAVILSAQCTDARVNIVTADLFKKYDTLEKFAEADLAELEKDIHSTGFYHSKAKNIISCCRDLVEKHHGEVPRELTELTALAGVGRKTANVIRGNIYNDPSVVVDTHVKRISKKLGLTENDDPEKVEYDLMKVLPKDHWILWNIHIITLGRTICTARSPKCSECFLREYCPAAAGAREGVVQTGAVQKAAGAKKGSGQAGAVQRAAGAKKGSGQAGAVQRAAEAKKGSGQTGAVQRAAGAKKGSEQAGAGRQAIVQKAADGPEQTAGRNRRSGKAGER